eukprot:524391_1
MLILIWDHMIDWDVLFDLQKNKKQDYPSYNQISWDWHCGTKQHGFAILFIAHVKKMCKQIPKKNASHGCYNQINMSLSLKGEKAKKCPCFLHHPFINTSVKDLQVRIEPCGFTYLFDEKFEDFVEQYASSNKVDLSKISNWSEYDFPLHSLRQYLSFHECNEISYYLMKGTYEMIRKKDPKYDKQYSYGNTWEAEFIGALIFEIRIHIWWHIGLKRCKYQITSKGAPYISIDMCCQLLIEKRNELQKQFNNIRLYMDNICDHLWYLICIKKTEQNNVYLRKKIAN